jgi:hypothetical protein
MSQKLSHAHGYDHVQAIYMYLNPKVPFNPVSQCYIEFIFNLLGELETHRLPMIVGIDGEEMQTG